MTYDRTDYRLMRGDKLVIHALEHGIDEELAVVIAERFAKGTALSGRKTTDYVGAFRANFKGTKTHA